MINDIATLYFSVAKKEDNLEVVANERFAFIFGFLEYYTNLPTDDIKLLYEFNNATGIFDRVVDEMGGHKYKAIQSSVMATIERNQRVYETSYGVNNLLNSLTKLVDGFNEKINMLEDLKGVNFNKIVETANKIMGIQTDEIEPVSKIDESKIIE